MEFKKLNRQRITLNAEQSLVLAILSKLATIEGARICLELRYKC